MLDFKYQRDFFDQKMNWILSNILKARYSKFLVKCLSIWIPLTDIILESLEHFLKNAGTLISICGQLVVAVHGNVPIRKASNLNDYCDLVETAVYKAPQINGSWIKFPCLVDSCSVDLIMEFHTEDDVPYKLYHEGDFHWCTYTPEITYQILSGNAHWDDKFK